MTTRRSLAIAASLGAVAAGSLAGCTPAPLTALPDGVHVEIFQARDDYGPRRLEISVDNESDATLTIVSAAFRSPHIDEAGGAPWSRRLDILTGQTTNLRVTLGDSVCDPPAGDDAVDIAFALPDGRTGEATIAPSDPFGAIDLVVAQDCAEQLLARTVDIHLADALRTEQRDGHPVALLDVTYTPTGSGEPVSIASIQRTILLQPASHTETWPVQLDLSASDAPVTRTLDIVPANCRIHTVAEDKRGTYFPFTVTTSAGDGLFYLPVTTAVKEQFYAYIADYCGWNTDEPSALDGAGN